MQVPYGAIAAHGSEMSLMDSIGFILGMHTAAWHSRLEEIIAGTRFQNIVLWPWRLEVTTSRQGFACRHLICLLAAASQHRVHSDLHMFG